MTAASPADASDELERFASALRERKRVEARAGDADRLERELAAERAGLPDVPLRGMFLRDYEGPPAPEPMRIAWSRLIGRDDFLTASERATRALTEET